MAANADLLVDGMHSGLTAPAIVTERTIAQMERMAEIPIEAALIPSMVKVADDADRERIREVVRDVVLPADAHFLATLRGEYRHASREEPGIWSAPNGDQLYRTAIRSWTTLDMDPEVIHQTGLDELERIEAERRDIAQAAGYGDDTAAYRAALDSAPGNTPASKAELVERATEDIERAMAIAPRFFGVLPRATCEVRPVEEYKEKDAPFAYYFPPSVDGSRSGIYYANGYDLPSRKYSKLASTTYHEAAPGHHFQITLEMESDHLNRFRRLGARMVGGAYVEGWGLYSERLADEMGLYRDEGERFGMLDGQAWRAARLVVDTGLHALRWERQRSIDFLQHAGLSETDAVIETDRYICWPGQALTYKTGRLEIERLRREISARDGSAFRPPRVPRRGARPRLAAAGNARPGAAELGGDARLTVGRSSHVRSVPPLDTLQAMDSSTRPVADARTRSRLLFLLVGGWLLLAVLLAGFAILAFGITTFADVLAPCTEPPCAPVQPVDPILVVALIAVALVAGFLGFGVAAAPTRRALAVSCAAAIVLFVISVAWTVLSRELVALAPTILALPIAAVSWVTRSMTKPPPAR